MILLHGVISLPDTTSCDKVTQPIQLFTILTGKFKLLEAGFFAIWSNSYKTIKTHYVGYIEDLTLVLMFLIKSDNRRILQSILSVFRSNTFKIQKHKYSIYHMT